MSYEKYFIDVSGYEKIDIYRYLELLPGERGHAIEHALKKLALCGVRTGGKSLEKDITEARDTLNRWLEMREEDKRIKQGDGNDGSDGGGKSDIDTVTAIMMESRYLDGLKAGWNFCVSDDEERYQLVYSMARSAINDARRTLKDEVKEWPSDERIDTIGQNGNEGEHYKRKEYRDLEKPETWKVGDYAEINWLNHTVIAGEIISIKPNSQGEPCITVDSCEDSYVYSWVVSVEARS